MTLGKMRMPADFRYKSVYLKGKPVHTAADGFARKHPAMDLLRRAKIFSPFDALRGFDAAVISKDVVYVDRPEVSEDAQRAIDRRLAALRDLTRGRAGKKNRPRVEVAFFAVCTDPDSFACGVRGQIKTVSGACSRVDDGPGCAVTVGDTVIPFDDILSVSVGELPDPGGETDGQ